MEDGTMALDNINTTTNSKVNNDNSEQHDSTTTDTTTTSSNNITENINHSEPATTKTTTPATTLHSPASLSAPPSPQQQQQDIIQAQPHQEVEEPLLRNDLSEEQQNANHHVEEQVLDNDNEEDMDITEDLPSTSELVTPALINSESPIPEPAEETVPQQIPDIKEEDPESKETNPFTLPPPPQMISTIPAPSEAQPKTITPPETQPKSASQTPPETPRIPAALALNAQTNLKSNSPVVKKEEIKKSVSTDPIDIFLDKVSEKSEDDDAQTKRIMRIRSKLSEKHAESDHDLFDTESWGMLMNEAEATKDHNVTREAYELLMNKFPTSSRHWIQYAEFELRLEELERVEAIFARCLRSVLSVDLWKFYLAYIRRINSDDKGKPTTLAARGVISKAYEFVLQYVGVDKDAGPLWADYLHFQKAAEVTGTWEESQKMDSMRKAYHRAVATPLANVELLWREYDAFENSLNRMTAKKFLADKSPSYMTARGATREVKSMTESLNRTLLAKPPKWTSKEINQLEQWKQYISWEKSNPLHYDEGSPALAARIIYAYKQAMLVLRFYPEIWFDAANYWIELGKVDDAANLLKMGCEVMPTSCLLAFIYAELEEGRGKKDAARTIYESLITASIKRYQSTKNTLDERVQTAHSDFRREQDREREQLAAAQQNPSAVLDGEAFMDSKSNSTTVRLTEGELRERLRSRQREFDAGRVETTERHAEILKSMMQGISLAWIMFQRFSRRVDGVKTAREVFAKARKSGACGWEVYVASALMEYYNSKEPGVAGRIFELGLKSFGQEPQYIAQYLEHLIHLNDDGNTRALFERTLQTLNPAKAQAIWKLFSDYENKFGDMTSISKVEKRKADAETNDLPIKRCIERYNYLDIELVQKEVGSIAISESSGSAVKEASPKREKEIAKERPQQQDKPAPIQHQQQHHHRGPMLLDSVCPERYPRPDLARWVSYKPPPAPRPVVPPPVPAPAPPAAIPAHPAAVDKSPAILAAQLPNRDNGPVPTAPATGSGAPAGNAPWGKLPEAVAFFMTQIPPTSLFGPPLLNPNEVIQIFQTVIIPPPIPPTPAAPAGAKPFSPPRAEADRRPAPHFTAPPSSNNTLPPNQPPFRDWDQRPNQPPLRGGAGNGNAGGPGGLLPSQHNLLERSHTSPQMGGFSNAPSAPLHQQVPTQHAGAPPFRNGGLGGPQQQPQQNMSRDPRERRSMNISPFQQQPPPQQQQPPLAPASNAISKQDNWGYHGKNGGADVGPYLNGGGGGMKRKPAAFFGDEDHAPSHQPFSTQPHRPGMPPMMGNQQQQQSQQQQQPMMLRQQNMGGPPAGMPRGPAQQQHMGLPVGPSGPLGFPGQGGAPPLGGAPTEEAMFRGGRPVKRYRDDGM